MQRAFRAEWGLQCATIGLDLARAPGVLFSEQSQEQLEEGGGSLTALVDGLSCCTARELVGALFTRLVSGAASAVPPDVWGIGVGVQQGEVRCVLPLLCLLCRSTPA